MTTTTTNWHGVGRQITGEDTVKEAGLDWTVEQRPLFIGEQAYVWEEDGTNLQNLPTTELLPSHVVNYRSDTKTVLGIVGKNYNVLQNEELAFLVETIESQTGVGVESGQSMRGGKDVFFMIRNSGFKLPGEDEVETYHFFGNNHAGERCFSILPTSISLICSNQLNMLYAVNKKISLTIRHTNSMMERVKNAMEVITQSEELGERFEEQCRHLASKDILKRGLRDYFDKVHVANYGPTPDPSSEEQGDKAKLSRYFDRMDQWTLNFDEDTRPTSTWSALNAVTKWVDHDRTVRGEAKDPSLRTYANTLGTAAKMKDRAFAMAMEMH